MVTKKQLIIYCSESYTVAVEQMINVAADLLASEIELVRYSVVNLEIETDHLLMKFIF